MSVLAIHSPIEKPRQSIAPEEMSRLPDDGRVYELVNGKLVEKVVSDTAHLVADNLKEAFAAWSPASTRGRSLVEATFRCFSYDPGLVRRPDVAFISLERLGGYTCGRGHIEIVPDIAVEIISATDEVIVLEQKIREYLRVGVRRVWVVIPEFRTVRVHRALRDISELVGDDVLTDPEVLPGFRCPLSILFAIPGGATDLPAAP